MPIDIQVDNQTDEKKLDTPVEGEKVEAKNEQAQTPNPYVEKATAHGWMPKEEWIEAGNDEDDWKPAKTFVEYGEMLGKIRNQSKELQDTRVALQHVATKNKEIYEKGYQAALTQLRAQKREALAEGDLVKADELDEKIDATKEELQQVRATPVVPQRQQQVDPEHLEWVERNPWYNDGVMQKFADALAIEYVRVNQGQVTPSDVRNFVEKEVKKEFAHKFNKGGTKGAPNPDGEGRSTGRADTGSKLDSKLTQAKANMSEAERSIMKTMMKTAGLTEKEYLQMYSA